MGTAADARVAADHTHVAGEPADHARQPAGDAREPDRKRYPLIAASGCKALANKPGLEAAKDVHRTHASQTHSSHRLGLADKRVSNKPEARRQSFWCLSW